MKTILTITILALLSISSFAQTSNLTIFSEDGNPFYLILNGIRQNETPETNVRVDNLMNEYYSTKVIFGNQDLGIIERKVLMVVDADANKGGVTYKIKRTKKGTLVLRYFGFTPAAQVVAPPAHIAVVQYNSIPMPTINFNAGVSTTTTTTTTSGSSDNVNVSMNIGLGGLGANVHINDGFGGNSSTTTTTTTTSSSSHPNNTVVYQEVEEDVCYPMASSPFDDALKSIKSQSFSDSKLSQAKQITKSNCLRAKQIKEICKLFSFEDTKMQYAKFAHKYCYDQNNYWQINDVFSFSSSVEELNDYIKNK